MELSGYRVEIIGGKHLRQTSSVGADRSGSGSWWPWPSFSPFSPFSSHSGSTMGSSWGLWPNSTSSDLPRESGQNTYVEMRDNTHYAIAIENSHSTRCYVTIKIDGNQVGKWLLEPYQRASIERPVDQAKKFTFFKTSSEGGQQAGLVKGDSNNGLIQVEFIPEKVKHMVRALSMDVDDESCSSNSNLNNFFESQSQGQRESAQRKGMPRGLGFGARQGRGAQGRGVNCIRSNSNDMFSKQGQGLGQEREQEREQGLESVTQSLAYESGGTGLKGKSDQEFRSTSEKLDLDTSAAVIISLRLVARKEESIDYDRITPLVPRANPVPPPIW